MKTPDPQSFAHDLRANAFRVCREGSCARTGVTREQNASRASSFQKLADLIGDIFGQYLGMMELNRATCVSYSGTCADRMPVSILSHLSLSFLFRSEDNG